MFGRKSKKKQANELMLSDDKVSVDMKSSLSQRNQDNVDDEITDEALEKMNKRRNFLNRWKLGKHHKMERFGVLFVINITLLVLVMIVIWTKDQSLKSEELSDKVLYSTNLVFSKTDHRGEVLDVYRNSSDTTAYIIFKMNDTKNMSLNADTYEVFVTGYKQNLKFKPAGAFFVFGSTGYMGLELSDTRGIPAQVLEIVIRANKDIREVDDNRLSLQDDMDASYKDFDQARFYVNIGASKVKVLPALDKPDLDSNDLYYELIGKAAEKEIRKEINTKNKELDRLYARADEYTSRLEDLGFDAPTKPEWLDKDYVIPGSYGLQYNDEKHVNLKTGYISEVLDNYSDFNRYMQDKRNELRDNDRTRNDSAALVDKLTRKDGSELVLSSVGVDTNGPSDLEAVKDVEILTDVWRKIYSVKYSLQVDMSRKLLMLDAEQIDQSKAFSIGDQKRIILW